MNHRDLFLKYVETYNTRNVSGMLAFFGEECVFENVSAGKVTVRTQGKAELESLAKKSAEAFASREQKVISIIEDQNCIAAEIDFQGVLQADLSDDLKAGTELKLRGVSVVEFSAGKIVRITDYS